MFQPLIGTIKTILLILFASNHLLFQSLIGTIKTYFFPFLSQKRQPVSIPHRDDKNDLIDKYYGDEIFTFQSLIGTIKTYDDSYDYNNDDCVSIPHRDDKNPCLFPYPLTTLR